MQGLRELKKHRTKTAIQEQAVRLFTTQGFTSTTIEQIAAAAEVSPSTFFRYFPTKEAVVIYDPLDPFFVEVFRRQPKTLSAIQAFRHTIKEAFLELPAERIAAEERRAELIRTVPELRETLFTELIRNINMITELITERTGRASDTLEVRSLAGALVGVMIGMFQEDNWKFNRLSQLDGALAQLEKGFTL